MANLTGTQRQIEKHRRVKEGFKKITETWEGEISPEIRHTGKPTEKPKGEDEQ